VNINKAAVETHFLLEVRDSAEARTVMTPLTREKAPVRRHAIYMLEQPHTKKIFPEKWNLWCLERHACFSLCFGFVQVLMGSPFLT